MAPKPIEWREPFLAALREYPVLSHACEAVGINPSTVWRRRDSDAEFAEAVNQAMETGIDRAEKEAFRRGVHGWNEPIIDKGRIMWAYRREVDAEGNEHFVPIHDADGQPVPLTIKKHSDSLLQFVLKGRRRATYGDKQEITGANGGPVAMLDETAKAARVAALLELAKTRKDLG